jgi:hypothetical protein
VEVDRLILQEGDLVAWWSNLDGIDAGGGGGILFHSTSGRLTVSNCRLPRDFTGAPGAARDARPAWFRSCERQAELVASPEEKATP